MNDIPQHLRGLTPEVREQIVAAAREHSKNDPPATPEQVERLRRLVQRLALARARKREDVA